YALQDMLTPLFYNSPRSSSFRNEVNRFVYFSHKEPLHHPLENTTGQIQQFTVPDNGAFGAGKGPGGTGEHHPAVDMYVRNAETEVELFAACDGYVSTYRDAPKYRQYLAISSDVITDSGLIIGKMVTLYAHIDLDLDEADSIFMDGQYVNEGDLISKHLYSGTMGGPHLHFEIRYYKSTDQGDETYYGFSNSEFTEASAGIWTYGYWNPDIGYGFGNPVNHIQSLY
ncbi:M23 family metallopeptidase, partial [bacterium]|nr:M23 family metallopeptidase [bacterium]